MKIDKNEFKNYITSELKRHDVHLSLRICCLMEELKVFENHDGDEVSLFELLVRLVFIADQGPADAISNLLTAVDTENSHLLDEHTITEAASFIRDFLKKDYVLYILRG